MYKCHGRLHSKLDYVCEQEVISELMLVILISVSSMFTHMIKYRLLRITNQLLHNIK